MDDLGFGRLIRMARIRRRLRQADLAEQAGVSTTTVSRVERGHAGEIPLDTSRRVAEALDIRVELNPRARALDIDRVVNAKHTAMAGVSLDWIATFPGWDVRPEISFSEFGERGVIDLLCWHSSTRALLVVEIKTELVDFGELLGTLDQKQRLARAIGRRVGWDGAIVSSCLLVADSMTNRRRAAEHGALLRSALPNDSRELVRWFKSPVGAVRALRFVPDTRSGHVRSGFAGVTRVRRPKPPPSPVPPRSDSDSPARIEPATGSRDGSAAP